MASGWNPWEHVTDWAPGPERSNNRSYAQFLASVLNLSPDAIAKRLLERTDITPQLAGTLAKNASNFADTLSDWNAGPKGAKIPRSHIPRNSSLPSAYRAIVNVRLKCVEGDAFDETESSKAFTVVLDYDHNPTIGEVAAQAVPLMQNISERSHKYDWVSFCEPELVEVVGLERRT